MKDDTTRRTEEHFFFYTLGRLDYVMGETKRELNDARADDASGLYALATIEWAIRRLEAIEADFREHFKDFA